MSDDRAAPSSSPPVQDALLSTKLALPPLRAALVARPRLQAELRAAHGPSVTLITAPPGFGKTTLLASWLHEQGLEARDWGLVTNSLAPRSQSLAPRVAWLSLDAGDNDPARFWRYVFAALARHVPELDASVPARRGWYPIERTLTALINTLAQQPGPLILALDDYHLISTPEIHAGLTFLIEHMPPQLQIALASRTIPPLPWPRLRVRGRLVELHAADLRFTPAEAAALLRDVMRLPLTDPAIAALVERTEGWGAGLILAALALRGRDGAGLAAPVINGGAPALLDYIVGEVLQNQTDDIRRFLLHTAVLDRFCAPLCDALTAGARGWGRGASEQAQPQAASLLLERLERANLFIVPLDEERRWFRYHHLFAEALGAHLRQTAPELAPELHRRAADWFAAQQLYPEAIGHALAARAWSEAGRLVALVGRAMLMRGEVVTVQGWLAALPDSVIWNDPRLSLMDAWMLVLVNDLDGAERHAVRVDTLEPCDQDLRDEQVVLRTMIAALRGTLYPGSELPQVAPERLRQNSFLYSIAVLAEGFPAQYQGNVREAARIYAEAARIGEASGNVLVAFIALCELGEAQIQQGRLRLAEAGFQRALAVIEGGGPLAQQISGLALSGLGYVAYERGELAQAEQLIHEGIARCGALAEVNAVDAHLTLAQIAAAQDDLATAEGYLASAATVAHRMQVPVFELMVTAHQVELLVRRGDLAAARAWLAHIEQRPTEPNMLSPMHQEIEQLAQVRVLNAIGAFDRALDVLARVLPIAEAAGRGRNAIEALILRAVALDGNGAHAEAQVALAQAHALAEPEGFVQIFSELVPQGLGTRGWGLEPEAKLLAPRPQSLAPQLEPLSPREHEVLRLVAEGLTNDEIAARLIVAPSTVKKHVNHLFAKLGVRTRTQALVRARAAGLL